MLTVPTNIVSMDRSTRSESGNSSDLNPRRNPKFQQEIMRAFNREWRAHLSLAEFGVLSFILDCTVNWGLADRRFSYRFMESGDNLTCGTGVKKRTLIDTIAALEAKGFIVADRTDTRKGLLITPNTNWTPDDQMLPVSERLKNERPDVAHKSGKGDNWIETPDNSLLGGAKNHTPPVRKIAPPRCQNSHPIKEELLREELFKEEESLRSAFGQPASVSEGEFFPEVVTRHRQRPLARIDERNPPIARPPLSTPHCTTSANPERQLLQPGAIMNTFRRAFEIENKNENTNGALFQPWSRKEMGMLKSSILSRWNGTPEECHEMFEWIVRDWFTIRRRVFGWMKRPACPEVPDIMFIVRHRPRLMSAYAGKKLDEWVEHAPSVGDRRIRQLFIKGKTREEILLAVAEEHYTAKMREENAKAKAEAGRAFRTALLMQKNAESMQRRGIHPGSDVAKQMRAAEALANAPVCTDQPLPSYDTRITPYFRED
ncbi:hypothetical protein [Phyllobacterium sp. K27]